MIRISKEDISISRTVGRFAGYYLARELAKDTEPVYIMGIRIHHYVLILAAQYVDNDFLKGILEGAGLEDLPDLLDDYANFVVKNRIQQAQLKKLANNLRTQQGKKKKKFSI